MEKNITEVNLNSADHPELIMDYLRLVSHLSGIGCIYFTENREFHNCTSDTVEQSRIVADMTKQFLSDTVSALDSGSSTLIRADFGLSFLCCGLPEPDGYVIIGPFRQKRPTNDEMNGYAAQFGMDDVRLRSLNRYLCSVSGHSADESCLRFLFKYVYHTEPVTVNSPSSVSAPEFSDDHASFSHGDSQNTDERYRIEQELRSLVSAGESNEAVKKFREEQKTAYSYSPAMDALVRLISCNITCKQALIDSGLPNTAIEQLYASYIRDISSGLDDAQLHEDKWETRIIEDYCALARSFSLSDRNVSRITHRAINYIMLHYCEKISVTEIAAQLGLSPNYLSTLFKKEMGTSLTNYINQVRINSSLSLLANTDLSISEVAEKVGIDDYNYFTRIFKKQMNIPPTTYRNDYQGLAKKVYQQTQEPESLTGTE